MHVPLGPLDIKSSQLDLRHKVLGLAGARSVQTGAQKAQNPFFCIFHRSIGAAVLVLGFLSTLVVGLDW